jgi:hypothetical protein
MTAKETRKAIFLIRRDMGDNPSKERGLMMVQVPRIVNVESGVNCMLDRDGSTPIQFHIRHDREQHRIDAQAVRPRHKVSIRNGMSRQHSRTSCLTTKRKVSFSNPHHAAVCEQQNFFPLECTVRLG